MTAAEPTIRVLDRADAAALDAVNLACPIEAGFSFVFDRRPDFFAWPDAVFERATYVGAFRGERLVGYALCGVTRGFTGAGVTPFFYVGDWRVLPELRGAGLALKLALAHIERRPADCRLGFFLIKEGNRAAEAFMRPDRRLPLFAFRPLCRLDAVNVLLLRLPPPPGRARVRLAVPSDHAAVAALVRRELGARLFGPPPPAALAPAPPTWVAERDGRIVGTVAAWDEGDLRRTRVLRYPLAGRLLRAAYEAGRLAYRGAATLPAAGEAFRALTLTRLAVDGRDPVVLADLLGAIAREARPRGYHMLHVGFTAGDPLAAATRGFLVQRFRSRVFLLQQRDGAGPAAEPPGARDPYIDLALV
jgi:hypothetical protein